MELEKAKAYRPARHQLTIHTIEAHTGGEPLRVIVGGWPDVPGDSILARRRYCLKHFDHLRTALMFEPRGHADMYGCLVTPAVTQGSDFGVLFMHNEGYSTMCGHGIIAVSKVAVETGLLDVSSRMISGEDGGEDQVLPAGASLPGALPGSVDKKSLTDLSGVCPITIDTPAGTVYAEANLQKGKVESVSFRNVSSFVEELDAWVDVPGLGRIRYDLAFGGAYYAYVQATDVDVKLDSSDYRALIEKGMAIKRAVMSARTIVHPFENDLGFLYGTIFIGAPVDPHNHSRNVCIFAEGEVDRSPTGTGVSGRAAIHAARGEIANGESIVIESILGTTFSVSIAERLTFGGKEAIVPFVTGSASITGRSEFWIDLDDPLYKGFILR